MRFISLESKSPIILAAVLFALLIIISGQIKEESEKSVLEGTFSRVTSPLVRAAFGTFGWFSSWWDGYMSLVDVNRENIRLKEELEILKLREMIWDEEKKKLRKMEEIFDLKGMDAGQHILGEVVFLTLSETTCMAVVNRGINDGVKTGMNVITPQGLIGIVRNVDRDFSKVILLIDRSSRIAVKVLEDGKEYQAILAGNGSGYYLDFMMGQYIIKIGDDVVTSGKDRLCFPGLFVGRVETVSGEYTGKTRITVTPSVDLNALSEVIILKDLKDVPAFMISTLKSVQ